MRKLFTIKNDRPGRPRIARAKKRAAPAACAKKMIGRKPQKCGRPIDVYGRMVALCGPKLNR